MLRKILKLFPLSQLVSCKQRQILYEVETYARGHSFRSRTYAYDWVRNIIFSEDFVDLLN